MHIIFNRQIIWIKNLKKKRTYIIIHLDGQLLVQSFIEFGIDWEFWSSIIYKTTLYLRNFKHFNLARLSDEGKAIQICSWSTIKGERSSNDLEEKLSKGISFLQQPGILSNRIDPEFAPLSRSGWFRRTILLSQMASWMGDRSMHFLRFALNDVPKSTFSDIQIWRVYYSPQNLIDEQLNDSEITCYSLGSSID